MSAIEAIQSTETVPPGLAEGSPGAMALPVDPAEYRETLRKSFSTALPPFGAFASAVSGDRAAASPVIVAANTRPTVGIRGVDERRFAVQPGTGASDARPATVTAPRSSAPGDNQASQPPAGFGEALTAGFDSKTEHQNPRRDLHPHPVDEPASPPRGFFGRSPSLPVVAAAAVEIDESDGQAPAAAGVAPVLKRAPDEPLPAAPAVLSEVHEPSVAHAVACCQSDHGTSDRRPFSPQSAVRQPAAGISSIAAFRQPAGVSEPLPDQSPLPPLPAATAAVAAPATRPEHRGLPLGVPTDDAQPQPAAQAESHFRELPAATSSNVPHSESPSVHPPQSQRADTGDRTELVQRVADAVEQAAQHSRPFRVRLHPPELGTLQVEIAREENGVSARLHVETASARSALVERLSELRHSLTQHGFVVDRIEVQVAELRPFDESRPESHSHHRDDSSPHDEPERRGNDTGQRRDKTPQRGAVGRPERAVHAAASSPDRMDIQV